MRQARRALGLDIRFVPKSCINFCDTRFLLKAWDLSKNRTKSFLNKSKIYLFSKKEYYVFIELSIVSFLI